MHGVAQYLRLHRAFIPYAPRVALLTYSRPVRAGTPPQRFPAAHAARSRLIATPKSVAYELPQRVRPSLCAPTSFATSCSARSQPRQDLDDTRVPADAKHARPAAARGRAATRRVDDAHGLARHPRRVCIDRRARRQRLVHGRVRRRA